MINVPSGYTDAHGFVYNNAVLLINHCTYSNNQSLQSNLQIQDGVPTYQGSGVQSHTQLGFTAVIFASSEALASGKPPISFKPANHPEYFNIQLNEPINESQILSICEQWVETNIFNIGE